MCYAQDAFAGAAKSTSAMKPARIVYPVGPTAYVESAYFAMGTKSAWAKRRLLPVGVAVSIRCSTRLIPVTSSGPSESSGENEPYKGNYHVSGYGCGEGNLRGYNNQLGWQYAHTSSGTNYLLDSSDWNDTGPDGPGYYAQVGNSTEKLDLGRSDDGC